MNDDKIVLWCDKCQRWTAQVVCPICGELTYLRKTNESHINSTTNKILTEIEKVIPKSINGKPIKYNTEISDSHSRGSFGFTPSYIIFKINIYCTYNESNELHKGFSESFSADMAMEKDDYINFMITKCQEAVTKIVAEFIMWLNELDSQYGGGKQNG